MPVFAKALAGETGQTVHDQHLAWRLRQAGALGDRRPATADVVTLALADDVDAIATRADSLPANWQAPAAAQQRALHLDHRVPGAQGQPKGIRDWPDLVKPGVRSSRRTRRPPAARAGTTSRPGPRRCKQHGGDEGEGPRNSCRALQQRAGARHRRARRHHHLRRSAASATCCIAWENEAQLASKEFGEDKFEIVYPSLVDPGRAAGGAGRSERRPQRHAQGCAEAYLECLYTPEAQEIARASISIARATPAAGSHAARFPELKLVTIDELRRLGQGAARAFRRGRHLRPDLHAGDDELRPSPAGDAARPPGLRAALRHHHGLCLSLIVLVPLAALVLRDAGELGLAGLWQAVADAARRWRRCGSPSAPPFARRRSSTCFGLLRRLGAGPLPLSRARLLDALVDLPFALPTAVAGIALTALYAPNGWLGALLAPLGIKVAYTPLGILVALVFVGLPFVVRTCSRCSTDSTRDRGGLRDPRRHPPPDLVRVILPTLRRRC